MNREILLNTQQEYLFSFTGDQMTAKFIAVEKTGKYQFKIAGFYISLSRKVVDRYITLKN